MASDCQLSVTSSPFTEQKCYLPYTVTGSPLVQRVMPGDLEGHQHLLALSESPSVKWKSVGECNLHTSYILTYMNMLIIYKFSEV